MLFGYSLGKVPNTFDEGLMSTSQQNRVWKWFGRLRHLFKKKKEQLTKTEALLQIGCYVYKSRSSERPDERETKSVCAWGF